MSDKQNELMLVFGASIADAQKALNDLKAGIKDYGHAVPPVTEKTEDNSRAALRNWKETNRMSGAFQGAAIQMSGMSGFGIQAYQMMDNLGDSFERNSMRGRSFGDVLGALGDEVGMIASGVGIAGAAAAFKYLNDAMNENIETIEKANKIYETIMLDRAKVKLDKLTDSFKSGKISVEDYTDKYAALSTTIAKAETAKGIADVEAKLSSLDDRMGTAQNLKRGGFLFAFMGGGSLELIGKALESITNQQKDANTILLIAEKQRQNEMIRIAKESAAEVVRVEKEERLEKLKEIKNAELEAEFKLGQEKYKEYIKQVADREQIERQGHISRLVAERQFTGELTAEEQQRLGRRFSYLDKYDARYKNTMAAERRALLKELKDGIILEKEYQSAILQIDRAVAEQKLMITASTAARLQQVFAEHTVAYKALGIIQATIDTYVAANKALTAGPILGPILMAATIAAGLANVAQIVGISGASSPPTPSISGSLSADSYDYSSGNDGNDSRITNKDSGSLGGAQSLTVYQTNSLLIQGNVYADDLEKRIFNIIFASNRAAGAVAAGGI